MLCLEGCGKPGAYSGFSPYKYSQEEILDMTYKSDSGKWIVFTKLPIVFVQQKLVYETAAPKGWETCCRRWKGKVAYADPHKSVRVIRY